MNMQYIRNCDGWDALSQKRASWNWRLESQQESYDMDGGKGFEVPLRSWLDESLGAVQIKNATNPIAKGRRKRNGRDLFIVIGFNGKFSDADLSSQTMRKNLLVKDKIIREFIQRKGGEKRSRIDSRTGVQIGIGSIKQPIGIA